MKAIDGDNGTKWLDTSFSTNGEDMSHPHLPAPRVLACYHRANS